MSDDRNDQKQAQRNQEPRTIDVSRTGNHASGNLRTPGADVDAIAPRIRATGLIWIEQEDQAKQGMARKGDMRNAVAAPSHPHIGYYGNSRENQ